jgi:hypothetical protein
VCCCVAVLFVCEREIKYVCVWCVKERECLCVAVFACERDKERERVCVCCCVCVWKRERECVSVGVGVSENIVWGWCEKFTCWEIFWVDQNIMDKENVLPNN